MRTIKEVLNLMPHIFHLHKKQNLSQTTKTKKVHKFMVPVHHLTDKLRTMVPLFNRYSIVFHIILSCLICFMIECASRRSLVSAIAFADEHTMAFLYNSFVIFSTLSIAYLVKRRALVRVLISGLWMILGIVNGCVLAKRVTPFNFTDLKLVSDLFEMKNTHYITLPLILAAAGGIALFLLTLIWLTIHGPKYQGHIHKILSPLFVVGLCILLPVTTKAAQDSNILATYFSNIAQGYENYGFVYGFSSSVVDQGMKQPEDYSQQTIDQISSSVQTPKTSVTSSDEPNIIVVLLESFVDPTEVNYLKLSQDPIPNFRNLYNNYSSGHLTVPVVGAGTANTEFEVLTGMSIQYFGTGEYPYKTVLQNRNSESIASDLSSIGYSTHAIHNNLASFYSRNLVFSQFGFDTFTSQEMMNITEYTPLGDWPTDHILVNETKKALDSTPNQSDFVYTITVQGHGDYPSEKIIQNPEITVSGAPTQALDNEWEYYVNEIHQVDNFIGDLTTMLSQRDEHTIVVFFGDHLPSMGLTDENMKTGDIYKTKYITWNNYGLPKQDADLAAYQLLANATNQAGIHEGTMFRYTQSQMNSANYLDGLDNLQYDILYGDRYIYNQTDKYPASTLKFGVEPITASNFWTTDTDHVCISGSNFTPSSVVYVNDKAVNTTYISDSLLMFSKEDIASGDTFVVNQVGSSNIYATSNTLTYDDTQQADTAQANTIPSTESSTESSTGEMQP